MKTRVLVLSLVAAAALALVGAGVSGRAAHSFKVAFVTDVISPADAHDFRHLAYRSFVRAVKDFGVQGRAVQFDPRRGPAPTLAALARQRYDLIILLEFYAAETPSVLSVVSRFPATTFALADLSHEAAGSKLKNLIGSVWRVEEPSYLAGYLAASMERRRSGKDVIGVVGGYDIPPVDRFIAGYESGARKAVPGIRVLRSFANDFLNPAKCKAVALGQIAAGAGVVFNVGGLCGLGTLEAAREKGVWGIGVDVDQSFLGSHILTSVLKHFDVGVYDIVGALVHGSLHAGGDIVWDSRKGAVGLGKISPRVPRSLLRRLGAIRAGIVAGRIRVPSKLS
jgi:basic membrane protein A